MIDGNPCGIFPPNFMKGLSKISSTVSLSAGFFTKIFFIKSHASGGALWNLGNENLHCLIN